MQDLPLVVGTALDGEFYYSSVAILSCHGRDNVAQVSHAVGGGDEGNGFVQVGARYEYGRLESVGLVRVKEEDRWCRVVKRRAC